MFVALTDPKSWRAGVPSSEQPCPGAAAGAAQLVSGRDVATLPAGSYHPPFQGTKTLAVTTSKYVEGVPRQSATDRAKFRVASAYLTTNALQTTFQIPDVYMLCGLTDQFAGVV